MVQIGRAALIQDVTWVLSQGATNQVSFQWNQGTDEVPVFFDFTGCRVRCQGRTKVGGTELFTLTVDESDDGLIEVDGDVLVVTLFPAASTAWGTAYRKGVWDVEVVDSSGQVVRLAMGDLVVSLEVTEVA